MHDVRLLLTDDDYAKIADILSARGFQVSTGAEAKAMIQESLRGEIMKVTRYYIALKRLVEESLAKIHVRGSGIGATSFKANLDHAKRAIGNTHIHMLDRDTWDIMIRKS